ncbi:MAG: hypothetical protein OXI48_08555 [bacterium]|nr:hypothetical protein [bacterium]
MKRSQILALVLTGVFVATAVSPAHAADGDWQSITLPDWGADPAIGAGDHAYEVVSGAAVGLQCDGRFERYEGAGIVTGPCSWATPVGSDPVRIRWRSLAAGWQGAILPGYGVPVELGMVAGDHDYEVLSGGIAALYCTGTPTEGSFREFDGSPGYWQRVSATGTVTGPCSHALNEADDAVVLLWAPAAALTPQSAPAASKTKHIIAGDTKREAHQVGRLADGKWRIRNFSGVEVVVWSSEDQRCTKPSTKPRVVVTIGEGQCDGAIELRVRNPNKGSYRIWMTKIS